MVILNSNNISLLVHAILEEKKHAWREMNNYLYNEIWQVGFIFLQQNPDQHTICGRINK